MLDNTSGILRRQNENISRYVMGNDLDIPITTTNLLVMKYLVDEVFDFNDPKWSENVDIQEDFVERLKNIISPIKEFGGDLFVNEEVPPIVYGAILFGELQDFEVKGINLVQRLNDNVENLRKTYGCDLQYKDPKIQAVFYAWLLDDLKYSLEILDSDHEEYDLDDELEDIYHSYLYFYKPVLENLGVPSCSFEGEIAKHMTEMDKKMAPFLDKPSSVTAIHGNVDVNSVIENPNAQRKVWLRTIWPSHDHVSFIGQPKTKKIKPSKEIDPDDFSPDSD